MRKNNLKPILKTVVQVAGVLLFGALAAFGQQQVNLTAGPTSVTLPDGSTIPMWGYSCGTLVANSTATCAALNKSASAWSPVVITVPTGQDLQINLTNHLTFTPVGGSPNNIPTSLTIVGQLGAGLGTVRTTVPSPAHPVQTATTWPIAGVNGSNNLPLTNTPPLQGPRVQSFSIEVAASATGNLLWRAPRPGTYLLESGTHPSIQGPMGLYGIVVVTSAPVTTPTPTAGTAYPGVTYDADIPLLLSEIDPVQNQAVSSAVNKNGFSETAVWSGQPGGCGNPASPTYQTCYPPAVNYTPLYYLINGVAFDKTHASASLFPVSGAISATPPSGTATGKVLVRLVNAGLRMHVPSIVGSQTGSAAANGFSLIAEDGNLLPGTPRVQSEVFLAAGKTYDVLVNGAAAGALTLPVYDRELSLSGNATARDAGMLAYISVNGGALPSSPALAAAVANPDNYNSVIPGKTLVVSDPGLGVIANDINVYGVKATVNPTQGTLTLKPNGTFTYVASATWSGSDSFVYQANGTGPTATVTLGPAPIEGSSGIVVGNIAYTSKTSTFLTIKRPGVLSVDHDNAGYPLTVAMSTVVPAGGLALTMDPNGGFNATVASPGTYTFTYKAQNSQGTLSASTATVTLTFPQPTNLAVTVKDAQTPSTVLTDYRWIIEQDNTFYVNPNNTTNTGSTIVPTFGVNFHTSNMPFVAQGCTGPLSCEAGQKVVDPTTGLHVSAVCDVGNGVCRPGTQQTAVYPSSVALDPTKRYYISVLPGDAANPFITGNASGGHTMGGAQIAPGQTAVSVLVEPTPLPTGKLSVFVFEDDYPLNGENDAGGGTLGTGTTGVAANEPGLGGFNIELFDDMGGSGDPTGQMTYDMFNMPLSNSLAGTVDPTTGLDACPIAKQATTVPGQQGITGMIVTCPIFESDGKTYSPFAGQALVANLMPGRFSIIATPSADRIARGEEWHQTNTLDGQKGHDSFIRIGEPAYFQEFGPASYHVSIGFANPAIIRARKPGVCAGLTPPATCTNGLTGKVTTTRMSRTPDERLYSSGSRDEFAFTQCYVSIGDPDGADFDFVKCDADGNFAFTGLPDGNWRITPFDQWNDQLVDGLSVPIALSGGKTVNLGDVPVQQWQSNIYTKTFIDDNKDGVAQADESGIPLIPVAVRYRDGSLSNLLATDFKGVANFNETFPLFNWYVVETDTTRYKNTGIHVVYDAGGPADGSAACGQTGYPPCGSSTIGRFMANTVEQVSLPANLRVPGAVYCKNADCTGYSIQNGPGSSAPPTSGTNYLSTGRIDPPWASVEGWQGFSGQSNFIEFGKTPYVPGENGGIKGHVIYASTRPFDDPQMLVQTQWEPLAPHVTINLYQEGTAPDGSQSLKLVDTTQTSSWDDWAQGFRSDGMPNMNCPGQSTSDLFYFTLYQQPFYLNQGTALPYNSQFKCYDGMHNWNQIQPAPYDGMYAFPSVLARNPQTGAPAGTNCTICTPNPTDSTPMLPTGKYVVEVVVPPGFELVKEEDKNILIGDNFIAPVTQEFGTLASIFIIPDQAQVAGSYNANNAQNPTQSLGTAPNNQIVPGFAPEPVWPCVGQSRIVPDYMSIFPQSLEVAPFAGATRNLCDRKEVTLDDQRSSIAKFYIYTSAHIAAHFTGVITDDFTSEFDPFAPQFGEKFAPANLPVAIRDWAGNEISRVYADQWGAYDGLNYSTWEVNPPNPTGYSPTMMVVCMNDAGPIPNPANPTQMITDPLYNSAYSQFCYELPFMPGLTQYMDTPVVPTSAFSEGYNHPDCNYPDLTPAIASVVGDTVAGPWVTAAGHTLTITALGDQQINNYAYSGPSATAAPYNQKTIKRHYGFGASQGTGGVTIGGVAAAVTGWSDTSITITAPSGVPQCGIQQQSGGSTQYCGQLVVTTSTGKQSVDTVTVTIGGKTPTVLAAGQTIQSAIDAASPGDLIVVPPGRYPELLLMWKPVRLQGVGAASSIIDANAHPAGKLDPWRRQVNCLFGLALNGTPNTPTNPYDPSGTFTCLASMQFQVDRIPLEAVVGWDATLNGNLAQQLQEPTLMGAYEGAGITVLAKGVYFPVGSNPFGADTFPTGTTLLTANDCSTSSARYYGSNFFCNPSRIDGLSITDSSQGGGGIFVHAWAHNLEIANNRVYGNTGTLAGGIAVGQGEFPGQYLKNGATPNADPGSCLQTGFPDNTQEPYCFDLNVNMHNNSVTLNSSLGDELFSATPSGTGGVTICNGSDYYKFNYNWVCGNFSTGDGGGVAHLGFIYHGDIEHNTIIFNQSLNPTIPTNGGGIAVLGTPDTDPVCGNEPDQDCPPGTSDGIGPGLVINANLILGNAAESGSGGGLRFHGVNGTELTFFPKAPANWYSVNVTNNIIANNVAGWDGAGVSLQDALAVNLVNNTIVSNDTTASAGVLFNTLGAPLSSSPPPPFTTTSSTSSAPQPAGVVTMAHSPTLLTNLSGLGGLTCPAGHSNCNSMSFPLLYNDIIWQNRAYYIGVGAVSAQYQQDVVTLYNAFTAVPAASQPKADATTANGGGVVITGGTGACVPGVSYWDIGVRGDTGPGNHSSGFTLAPSYSVLTDPGYSSASLHNLASNPQLLSQYCNGSRVPPEFGSAGYAVPPGIADATVPNPIFSLLPAATVDEGNNWINMKWGPLALTNPTVTGADGNYGGGSPLANYALSSTSQAIDYVPLSSVTNPNNLIAPPPTTDFFGHPRPDPGNPNAVDVGAVEAVTAAPPAPNASVKPTSLAFANQAVNTTSASRTLTLTNTGAAALTGVNIAVTAPFSRPAGAAGGTCTATVASGTSCTILIAFTPTTARAYTGSVTITAGNGTVTGSPVALTGTGQ